jgi:hypothetical protein
MTPTLEQLPLSLQRKLRIPNKENGMSRWIRFRWWWYRTTGFDASRFINRQIRKAIKSGGGIVKVPGGEYGTKPKGEQG